MTRSLAFVRLGAASSLSCLLSVLSAIAVGSAAESHAFAADSLPSAQAAQSPAQSRLHLPASLRTLVRGVLPPWLRLGTDRSTADGRSPNGAAAAKPAAKTGQTPQTPEHCPSEGKPPTQEGEQTPLPWHEDYAGAMDRAATEKKMLLVYFHTVGDCPPERQFETETLGSPDLRSRLAAVVRVKLPADAKITVGGEPIVLLKHAAFAEMRGLPGLAIIDQANEDPKFQGQVISAFPFLGGRPYTVGEVAAILDLPPGTLTQRTLIYAVRMHPERPASASSRIDPTLLNEAASHAEYQARIARQGHHFWESRFHRINARLPGGCLAYEVCAESWPGQGLLEAAIECVRCWRLSSGHWRSVATPCQAYGYDMKRGGNGVWYATGIVGR